MIKRFFILLLAIVASVGMSYALNPRSGDTWDDNTKTLTVNSDPDDYYNDQGEIKRLVISSSVTEIGEQAFSSSYNLESVIAYDGLQVIDQSAFVSCPKLESVILPSSLREVRYSAFSYCDNLKYVTINAPSLDDYAEYAFDDTHADLKIYVPEASVATYKYFWPAYASKFQAIPSSLAVGDTLKVGDAMYSATDVYVSAGYLCFQIKASSLHTISVIEPNGSGSKIKVEFTPYAEEFYPSGSYAALTNWFYCYSEYTSGDVTAITVVSGAGTLADPFVIDYVVPTAPAQPAELPGAFTINANGDKIVFSRGNLQAKTTDLGANWTWDFAPNQWSLIGNAVANNAINGNKTVSANGTVDLFGWSTAATYYGINKSWNNDDYTGDFVDWGALMGTEWRTLSRAEFRYIVFDRAQAFNKQGKATVNGVTGYIFLPDEWELPSGLSFTPSPGNYTTNQYDGADWTAMESAGAVFLPAAGDRSGSDIYMYDYGWYWTSTSTVDDKAYYLYFYEKSRDFVEHNRYDAKSVRLVTVAPKTPADVIALINAIGTVDSTPESKAKIDAAREAYETLSDADKALVTNYETLTNAETAYNNLFAQDVIDKINAIPTPVTLKLATRDAINNARAAYEALNAEQKALVPAADLQTLLDAEAALAALNPGGGMPADALNGKFTINAGGDQIAFAKGNLQATTTDLGANWTWGFAANQWEVIGNAAANNAVNGNRTVSANGTVDLFGWSTPTTYYGIHNSTNSDYYSDDFREWGENITGATWKTLSPSDWIYIISNRADAAQKQGQATVNGVNGYIFLPDEWVLPTGLSFTAKPNNWTANVYDGDDWTAMENAGAVFLPKSSWRKGNTVTSLAYGYYWSSDYNNYSNAMAYYFGENLTITGTGIPRYAGIYVRLVTADAGSPSPLDSAQAVKDLIDAIPAEITLEDACVNAILAARDAYNALSDAAKGALDDATVQKLNQAITDYTALIQAGADAVIAKINNIPQPVTLKLATRDSIQNARAAYDALTADQQALVTNYAVLEAAEAALAGLNPGGGMPADALNGKFTINAGGDQIAFAKGNLQATTTDLGANWTWGFAANQWNYLGIAVANNAISGNGTVSENGTVDLFGWSTAATYYGINNSYKAVDYPGDFVDWGPNMGAGWRTLTKDEWQYLIENNTKGRATVNDKNGYIFLPNDWSGPAFTPDPDNFTTNVYSGDDWTAMENAGAVFLPSGPARSGKYALIANDAKYSSSTSLNNDTSYVFTIYYNQSQSACTGTNRAYGCMVRLVTEGGGATPLDSALAVKDLIETIPAEITLEDACVNAVQAARDAYNALSDATKGALDDATVQKLNQAITDYTALIQAGADEVIAKIAAIPQPVTLKLATRDSIESARAAYDALTADQQALVSNYDVLTAAEAALATLNPSGGAPLPEGALTGAFSINADGDKIAFSKGNLQATTANLGETWTWAFAANQYDYVGNAVANTAITGNKTVSTNGTIDLFGWSTAATYYGINNSNVSGKHPGDFIDWGETIAEGWRTLTRDEWNYLFETRTDAASKYGHATVAGIHGIIVLPDSYKGTAINADRSDWSNNIISAEDWAAYEANGVAFLPAAGSRLTTNVNYVGEYGMYWTSTTYGEKWAYRVRFLPNLSPDYGDRVPGHSVRLVTAHTGGATPLDSAQVVKDLIEAIPAEITLEDACVNAVQAARDAYNALSDEVKGALDDATVQKLNQAITDYTALIQAGADAVTAKINNIPQPVTLKLATRDSIESARAAYDALTADQKLLVSNYDVLTAAEATWAGLINVAPAGALSGKYTINAEGDVIYFAHGNLQYTRENLDADWSTGTFRLATNQYDLIEADPTYPAAYCTDNYGDKTAVGLFGWGTWGEGKTPNLTSSDRTLYTWSTDFSGTLEGTNTWRTLSKDEWVYLLAHNNQSYATVHGVNGLLVAPDGKDIDGKSMADWVVINDETWTTMQNDGYLFLPACGQRSQMSATANITTGDQGEDVVYYSSTQYSDAAAHNIWYKPGQDPAAADYSNKRQAFGVRLVSVGVNPLDQVQIVKGLIDAIPVPVTLDDACVKAIEDARTAYDALDNDAKAILDAADVKKLTDAEAALTALNQAEADKVIAKINNIPTPVELKLATRDSIESARAAYDALNAAQQDLVTNYQTLLDAEAALAEKNKGGSIPMDIVWDGNTGIANVDPNTTSPAYEGMTVTVGQGSSFSTYQSRLYFTFYSQPNGGFIFANENGTNITKVVIESTTALTSTMKEVDRMGSGWVISNENKTATWTGNADSVSIWEGQSFTNYWVVDTITFTVNASSTPLDSAQAVKDLIDAIPTPVEYPTSGAAIEAALNAFNELSDAAKGALDAADVQKLNDAATQYAALEAIAAIEAIPAEIVYDPAVKAAIETAREKYNALSDASKALVDDEVVAKLTNAEKAWADLVAKVEHNVSYIGKDGELKHETVALLHIPDPAPDFNGYEFVRWDVKAGDFLEEGLRIKAIYTPIITTDPAVYDSLMYNGTAQNLITAGVAKEGHIEYRIGQGGWSTEVPTATNAGAYVVYYKLVREGHEDYLADSIVASIAKVPVTYVAPIAYDTLVYNAANQTLAQAGTTTDGTFWYSLNPTDDNSWKTAVPQGYAAGSYGVYYKVQGDINHLDSIIAEPIAVSIAKAELKATADDKSVIYGDLAPQYTVTYAGWQGDDDATELTGDIAFACEYAKGSPVGEYVITPSGVDAANYAITFFNGKLTVNRKSAKSDDITAKQADNEMLVYTAAVNKPTIQAKDTTKTLIEGTDYKLTFIGRGITEYAESVNAPIHVGEYTAIVDFIGNYKDTLTVDFAIHKAPLTITAEDKAITFGELAPQFTVAYEGFLGTDTATVLTGVQAYACEYERGNNVGEYTIIPSGVEAHDYAITFDNGTLTVNRKSAKSADIAAKQADNEKLVYDAEVNRPTIQVKDTTLVLTEAQDYVLTFKGVGADQSTYAESETAPTHVGNYTAIVAFIGNYIDTLTVEFAIHKAPLTITANDTAMIYGDIAPAFTVSYDGWFGNDDESVLLGTQAYDCIYAPGSPIGTYAITPKDVDAYDYAITFVDGTLTVNKAHVYVSGAEAHIAKFADSYANAEVTNQGVLNGIKLNDPIAHVTTAAFSSADVAENLTITLFYELTGDAALLNNYYLDPTSDIFTTEGVIIEPFIPDNEDKPEDEEATVNEGIEIYAYGYCDGSGYSLKYHLESGNPDQYKIDFADSRFTDVDWTNLEITGKDGTIAIEIPVDMPTGDYTMTVYFRDSRFDWLESRQFNVTFHVNLPETYVRPLFDNVIALVDTCHCLTDIQWYWRANSTELWQPIEGANGYYYHVDGKLTGEYFVSAKMNGEPTYTCGQTDMETLYGAGQQAQAPVVRAYPNPVVNSTTVTIENSTEWNHNIRIVDLMGAEVMNTTFEGNETNVEMGEYPQGNYMISVDGIVVKVMKQ